MNQQHGCNVSLHLTSQALCDVCTEIVLPLACVPHTELRDPLGPMWLCENQVAVCVCITHNTAVMFGNVLHGHVVCFVSSPACLSLLGMHDHMAAHDNQHQVSNIYPTTSLVFLFGWVVQ